MSRVLFVTPEDSASPRGGRSLLSHLHRSCLQDLLGENLSVHELTPASPRTMSARLAALGGRIDGVTKQSEQDVLQRIASTAVRTVYLDGSNLGHLAKAIKLRAPGVQVISFFHNVETQFFRSAFAHNPGLRALAVWIANWRSERLAVRFSDRRIALSQRDSALLRKLHGRAATDILQMAMQDQLNAAPHKPSESPAENYLLFVGGSFYANRAGIRWFAREVAPAIGLPTLVIGYGLDDLREELERSGNVRLIGAVESLEPWYLGAKAVIAPIFAGSGMKTKVAEALMFGKRIVGSPEAFVGYDPRVCRAAGWVCETRDQWVDCLSVVTEMTLPKFDREARRLFDERYSTAALYKGLEAIFASPEGYQAVGE